MPATAIRKNSVSFRLGKFATSKLIQNLGSSSEQYTFEENLRNAYGRD